MAAAASSSSASGGRGTASTDREAFTNALRSRSPNNHYICHLRIQEQDPDRPSRPKTRYLIAAVDRETGRVTLNKARGNPNGTYSIGKDWDLNLLQELEVHTPSTFTLTLTRPYPYTSTQANEQEPFLQMIVNVYRKYTGDTEGPSLINFVPQVPFSRSTKSSRSTAASGASSTSASQSASSSAMSSNGGMAQDDTPAGRPSTSSTRSTTSSQGQTLRTLNIPMPSIMSTSASSPTTPIAENPPFQSSFHSSPGGVSPNPSSSRRDRDEPSLRKAASSTTLSASQGGKISSPSAIVPQPQVPSANGLGADSTDDDDDPYGGAVVTDHPSTQPSPSYGQAMPTSTPARSPNILPQVSSRDPPNSTKSSFDSNGFSSQRTSSRTAHASLKRMGSSPHMSTGVPVPRRSESIPDLHRAANRRPGTAGSQGTQDGGRESARSRGAGSDKERGGALTRSPSTPSSRDGSRYAGELPKVVLPVESPPPMPTPPSASKTPDPVPSLPTQQQRQPQSQATLRPNPRPPGRVARTLSKVLPLDGNEDDDDDEDTTLAYVEEMLEGFEWRPMVGDSIFGTGFGRRRRAPKVTDTIFGSAGMSTAASSRGTADVIEARLLKELSALEEANIHGMVESDERVGLVIKHMDDALTQLDLMESMILRFKMQLNGRDEDINHIESQNGALQIHTSNQQKLAAEIERLLDTIHVDEGSIYTLKHASLESRGGIEELERAAGELYKSIVQATASSSADEGSVSAARERLDEYRALSERFCKRVFDHVNLTLSAETAAYLSDPNRQNALGPSRHPGPSLQNHAHLEELLGRYCGLVLYVKETSPSYFSRMCAAYYASVSECWKREMTAFFAGWKKRIKRGAGDDYGWEVAGAGEAGSGAAGVGSGADGSKGGYGGGGSSPGDVGTFGRAATIRKAVMGEKSKGAKLQDDGDLSATEVFQRIVDSVTPLIQGEQSFISDFLQINDSNLTFADYLDMEPYFRRRAAQLFGFGTPTASQHGGPMREMKSALELIFGFLAPEWDALVDYAVHMDKSQITPILAMLDRAITDAEDIGADYLARTLARAHTRLSSLLDKIEDEQAAQQGGAGESGSASAPGSKGASGEKKKKRVANLLRKHR